MAAGQGPMSTAPPAAARPTLPPNTGAQRAVQRAHPKIESIPGRLAGLGVGQVVLWQIAIAGGLFAAVRKDWTVIPAAAFALIVLILTLSRSRGRWLYQAIGVRSRFRARRRARPPYGPVDPRLVILREVLPELDVSGIPGRGGQQIGVAYDGRAWTGAVALQASDDVLPRPQQTYWLSVRGLFAALQVDDIQLSSVQVLRHIVPGPAGVVPPQSPVAASYRQLNARRTPSAEYAWVVVRADPALCADAIKARGGGAEGGRRVVKRGVARVVELLESDNVSARQVDEESLRNALALTSGGQPLPAAPGTKRVNEEWTSWQANSAVHVTWWVKSWPSAGIPMQLLQDAALTAPSSSCTVSLALHTAQTEGARFRVLVRLSAGSSEAMEAAAGVFEQSARSSGFGVVRLDGEQGLGLAATLPLGGGVL